jgi:hypothetical protein
MGHGTYAMSVTDADGVAVAEPPIGMHVAYCEASALAWVKEVADSYLSGESPFSPDSKWRRPY